MMQCNKCSLAIDRKNDRYTVCEGKCAKRYHAACVGLSEATMCALFSKNILWMCDACLLDFCSSRDVIADDTDTNDCCTHQTNCETEIEELKAKVNDIMDLFTTMISQRSQPETYNQQHSTPFSPPSYGNHLFDGTKETNECESRKSSGSGMFETGSDSGDTFSLFLTNVDRSTTNEDIVKLACECLNINDHDEVRVRRLVSYQSERVADYISFKVVFDEKRKSLAMKPSTWPKHIKFREFVNRHVIWKPSRS